MSESTKKRRRVTRQRNKVWENLPISSFITKRYSVYTTIGFLKRLQTFNTVEERDIGQLYYNIPGYGYVLLDDLNYLHCSDYKSKSALLQFIDSIKHVESPTIHLRWCIE
jgi:hypothetical protein